MKPKKTSKPIPRVTSTTIDADTLARINDKVAKAHEQIDSHGTAKPKPKPVEPKKKPSALITPESDV